MGLSSFNHLTITRHEVSWILNTLKLVLEQNGIGSELIRLVAIYQDILNWWQHLKKMSIIESYHLLSCTIIALNVGAGCSSQSLASLVVEISSSRSYFNFQFGGADVLSRLLLVNAVLSLEKFCGSAPPSGRKSRFAQLRAWCLIYQWGSAWAGVLAARRTRSSRFVTWD